MFPPKGISVGTDHIPLLLGTRQALYEPPRQILRRDLPVTQEQVSPL